jgi:anti-sigma factor RsiW
MRAKSFTRLPKPRRINAMRLSPSTNTDSHQQIRLLLPWYVNQTLPQEERHRVENHVRICLICRRELHGLEKLAKTVTETGDFEGDAEASFAALRSKLPPRGIDKPPPSSAAETAIFHKSLNFARPSAARFAMAASLLLALIPTLLYVLRTNTTGAYYTLSAAKPESADSQEVRVVFAQSLSHAEIDALLASIHSRRIDGPNSLGALTIRLDNGQDGRQRMQDAIAFLRSRQEVLLAEPVAQP